MKKAKVINTVYLENVRAIEVSGGRYRGATLDGVFEIVNEAPVSPAGKVKVKVCCSWFGVIPKTTYPNLDITNASTRIINNYTGEVVDNIGMEQDNQDQSCCNEWNSEGKSRAGNEV